MSNVNAEMLTEVKGLGPSKADAIIAKIEADGDISAASLAEIKGVSEDLAKRAVKAIKQHQVSAATEVEVEAEPEVASNGNHDHTAGEVRRFARTAQEFGFGDLAESLFDAAAQNLDDETVELTFG